MACGGDAGDLKKERGELCKQGRKGVEASRSRSRARAQTSCATHLKAFELDAFNAFISATSAHESAGSSVHVRAGEKGVHSSPNIRYI
eukprot:4269054-Pleurochrysis_carterae.AAC.1